MHCAPQCLPYALLCLGADVEHTDGVLKLNLLLNRARAGPTSTVTFPIRAGSTFTLSSHAAKSYEAPEWIASGSAELICRKNAVAQPILWDADTLTSGGRKWRRDNRDVSDSRAKRFMPRLVKVFTR